MEKCSEKATLDYKDGLLSVRIDCPGANNENSAAIRNSLSVYFLGKLLTLLAERGFIEVNDAEDVLFMFEDFLQNKGNNMDFNEDFDLFDLEGENGYF